MSYELCVIFAFLLRPTVGPTKVDELWELMTYEAMSYEQVYYIAMP